jgi:hypothetical protein
MPQAKISSDCPSCGRRIQVGEEFRWECPAGHLAAVHVGCPEPHPTDIRERNACRRTQTTVTKGSDEQVVMRPAKGVADVYDVGAVIRLDEKSWFTVLSISRRYVNGQ